MTLALHAPSAARPWRLFNSKLAQPYAFFMPAFILICIVSFFPLTFAIVQSFFRSHYYELGTFVWFDNYYEYLIARNGARSILNSLIYVLGTVAVTIPLGFGMALLLVKPFRFNGVVQALLILPWLVSNLVSGLIWAWLINPQYGLAPAAFDQAGLDFPNVITGSTAAMVSVIMASAWSQYPLVMVFMLAALKTVPEELVEAARMDGASALQIFWNVRFPLVRNTLMLSLILTTLHTFKNVEIILVMSGGGPNGTTETMALRIYQEAFLFFRMGVGSAGAVVVFLLNLLFALAFLKILRSEHGA